MRPLERHYAHILAVVFVAAAVLRILILKRGIGALDQHLADDAYISLSIARSIGEGHGPRFGEYLTNGFQPLFVWLMAIPFALAPEPATVVALDRFVRVAMGLNAVADLGCLLLLAHILRRHVGAAGALFGAFLWAIHPTFLRGGMNGLETSLAVLALLAIWRWALRWPFHRAPLRRVLGLGVLIGAGAMVRVDLLGLGVLFFAESVVLLIRERARGWWQRNLALAGGVALGHAPWLGYSFWYTGRLFPESGSAVRFITMSQVGHRPDDNFYRYMLLTAREALVMNAGALLPWAGFFVAAAVLFALLRPLIGARPRFEALTFLRLPLVFCATLLAAYTLYVLAPWFFTRYLFPCMVPLVAVAAMGCQRVVEVVGRRGFVVMPAAAALTAIALHAPAMDVVIGRHPSWGYRKLGLWARERYAAGTVVGADQAGAIAYYAPAVRVVNLDGVVNERAAAAARSGRLFEYARAERVAEIVGWQVNFECLAANSRGFVLGRDLRYVGQIREFRSWGNVWLMYQPRNDPERRPDERL